MHRDEIGSDKGHDWNEINEFPCLVGETMDEKLQVVLSKIELDECRGSVLEFGKKLERKILDEERNISEE